MLQIMKDILEKASEQRADSVGVRHTRFAVILDTYAELKVVVRSIEDMAEANSVRWGTVPVKVNVLRELPDGTFADCEILFFAPAMNIKMRLTSLELTGAWVKRGTSSEIIGILEHRRVGRYPCPRDGGCTWFGVVMF